MVKTLVSLLVLCIVIYVIYLILNMIQLPAPIKTIVYLIVGLVLLVWLLRYFGIMDSGLGNGHAFFVAKT